MAWRKGFFRVWVVVSIVWVIFVALVTYEGIASPYLGNRGVYYKKGVPNPVVIDEYSTAYRDLEAGKASGQVQKIEIEGYPDFRLFVPAGLPTDELSRRVDQVVALAKQVRASATAERRASAIWSALGAALALPGFLFASGLAISWTLAGFRRG
jgi:hypothetical protein